MSFKEEAQQALSRGEWRKALECFQKHCAQEPEDLRSQLKVAELLERLGQKKEAVQMYRKVAEAYAQDGFLLQAISINKMILRIDPSSKDVNDRLAQLYAEKDQGDETPSTPFRTSLSSLNSMNRSFNPCSPISKSRPFRRDPHLSRGRSRGFPLRHQSRRGGDYQANPRGEGGMDS